MIYHGTDNSSVNTSDQCMQHTFDLLKSSQNNRYHVVWFPTKDATVLLSQYKHHSHFAHLEIT